MAEQLPLGCDDYEKFNAIANEKLILEVAKLLQSLGDINIEAEQEIKTEDRKQELQRQFSLKEYFKSCLTGVFETIDVVLEWLEYSGKNASEDVQFQKKEGVLRGLYHFTALGAHASFLGFLELACKFLDVPENPYQAKREHIRACFSEVEEQKQQLFELVKEAGEILQCIIREPKFDHVRAFEFDKVVRQAKDVIESCKGLLASADETIKELTKYMKVMKWFSRGLRLAGWGLTCYGLYHFTPSSSSLDTLADYCTPSQLGLIEKLCFDSKLNVVFLATACAASGYAWVSLYPSRAYALHDSLAGLGYEHQRLTHGLHHLERKLKTAVDLVDGIRQQRQSMPNSSDTAI